MTLSVADFIRQEVPDWDEGVVAMARFKAFSGQRSDWEARFLFWRELIIKVARHLDIIIISASEVGKWFVQRGVTPLCIDHVLLEMCNTGDIVRSRDLKDPSSSHLHHMFKQVMNLVSTSLSGPQSTIEDRLILASLVQERASQVVGILSESHWTSSCVITTAKFQSLCKGNDEAAAVMSYLSGCGRARYLSINKKDCIEGVKLSLVPAVVPATSSLDYDTLRLVWTLERLQHQLEVLNQRYENARKSALALVKSGSKQAAVGYLRHSKSISESRTKCVSFINRVDEVLGLIADAESTKKVNEAIQIGARAIKENGISMEEVQICLQELNEGASSQKQIDEALQLPPFSYLDMEDEEVEEEFKRLKEEIGEVKVHETVPKNASKAAQEETQELAQSLSKGLSKLTLEPA